MQKISLQNIKFSDSYHLNMTKQIESHRTPRGTQVQAERDFQIESNVLSLTNHISKTPRGSFSQHKMLMDLD